ncbi:unnamed protein product [Rhizoctonia solani]|uniref:Cuticle-degrading protease n=1 Tax=Rhizoctonia solani TaxID=456999 RepID=A0A8H3CEW1_9AGAM|nr:unnamed protein product [Rhizoctonia solani]
MRSIFVLATFAFVSPVLGAPTVSPLTERGVEDTYIIKIKDGVSQDDFVSALKSGLTHPDSSPKYTYSVFNAIAVTIAIQDLPFVRAMKDVEYIEQDQVVSLPFDKEHRELEDAPPSDGGSCPKPAFDQNGGKGVTVYGIDTGINIKHECFGGRASWGATFGVEKLDEDTHGHGTHTAGTAVCNWYGVARAANIIAVKVLGASGSGQNSDVIAGVDYACKQYEKNGRPSSIITMSLGGGVSDALDEAIKVCASRGMHFTVAAGNDNKDAKDYSPARAPIANTVGAIDSTCTKASFSNFGPVLDIQAPGVDINSAWNLPGNSSMKLSGTSMATPYVAGVLAVALGKYGQMSPEALTSAMKLNAAPSAIGFPSETTNKIAQLW